MVAWRDTQDRIPYPERRLPHALRRGPCGTPALAASRLAASRAFTIAHVMDFLISSLLDGRHPAARFAPVGKKVTRLAVGPPAYMHGPGHGPRTCPGSAPLFAHWVAVTCMDAPGRRPRRRRRAWISCAAGEIAALRGGQAPPSGRAPARAGQWAAGAVVSGPTMRRISSPLITLRASSSAASRSRATRLPSSTARARRCPPSTRAFTAASICWAVCSL